MVSGPSTLGTRMPETPAGTTAARSSRQYSVSTPLMRTVTSQEPNSPWRSISRTSTRAESFSETDTASSRSRIRPSGPKRCPRTSMLGLLPGR